MRRFMTKERYDAQPLTVPCACGCGTLLPPLNKLGLPSTWVKGHAWRGKKHTTETKQKISERAKERFTEENGDRPPKHWGRHEDERYTEWRQAVIVRDGYRCVTCGLEGRHDRDASGLQVDHILPWATHPESRYDVANGRTLCYECHCDRHQRKIRRYGKHAFVSQPCACGCEGMTKPGRTYINGHGTKGIPKTEAQKKAISAAKEGKAPRGGPATVMVSQQCKCGCGQMTAKGRKYANGCKRTPVGCAVRGTLSEEGRAKISKARTGSHPTQATRDKMSKAHKGVPKSEAHRAALKEAAQRRWAKEPTQVTDKT